MKKLGTLPALSKKATSVKMANAKFIALDGNLLSVVEVEGFLVSTSRAGATISDADVPDYQMTNPGYGSSLSGESET